MFAKVMVGRVLPCCKSRAGSHADTVAIAIVGAHTVSACSPFPSREAYTDILGDTLSVAIALMVTMRLRAVITEPTLIAVTDVRPNTATVARTCLACGQSSKSSVANRNRALGTLPALPTPANSIKAVATV